jgi:hypothetical protein
MSAHETPAHDTRPRDRAAESAEVEPQRAPRPPGHHHGIAAPASAERIQFALLVGAVNDPEEREADRLADAVVQRLSSGAALHNPRVVPDGRGSRVRPAPNAGDEPASTPGRVRRSATGSGPVSEAVTGDLDAVRRTGGRPMDEPLRRRMELGFGADLGAVRVHTGPEVDSLNDRLAARAFTVGSDVFFRGGVPDTTTAAGTHLVAHELAHTMQQSGRIERRSVTIRRAPGDDDDAPGGLAPGWMRSACEAVAEQIRVDAEADLHKTVYKGLGGGGAGLTRSAEVKMFRGVIKEHARERAYEGVRAASNKRTKTSGKTATSDYQEMIGGNIAYKKTKKSVDKQMRTEEESLVLELAPQLQRLYDAAFDAAEAEVLRGRDIKAAQKAAKRVTKPMLGPLKTEAKRLKDTVVGKHGQGEMTDLSGLTTAGKGVSARVDERVATDKVGEKSLKKAIEAPSMSTGLRVLGHIIDGILSGAGETLDLAIEFSIPTGAPGLVVVIKMSGTAARGTNGATTAGVTTLGNPKRMELAAKFSVGVGADALAIKSDANVGFFIRSGSDKGTDAAIEALSYGAYRAAKPEAIANLWAPGDKMEKRTARHRAEIWAAMVEQNTFDDDTYADIGLSIDGGFGVNLPAGKLEIAIGESIFSHYDAKSLAASMGGDFGNRVMSDADASRRRENVSGEKKLALSASVSFEAGIGGNSVGFGLGVSGSNAKNWGAEITATVGMPSGVDSNFVDKLINQYIAGVGAGVKRLEEIFRRFDKPERGFYGTSAQLPADAAAIVDVAMENALRDGVKEVATNTVDKSAFDTTLGETFKGGTEQQEVFGMSTQLVFALTFGRDNGEFVVRLELRSSRGLDINAGTAVKISAKKTTRLLAVGRDGKKGAVVEIAGLRFDSKDD